MLGTTPHLVRGLQALEDLRPRAQVVPSRCSRTHGSGCTLCVSRCPVAALRVEEGHSAPVVDADACIGCGVCVVSCPTDALTGAGGSADELRAAADGAAELVVQCSRVPAAGADDAQEARDRVHELRVACLASLQPEAVAAAVAALAPGGTLQLGHGDCAGCPVATLTGVDEVVALARGLAGRVAPGRSVVTRTVPDRSQASPARRPGPARRVPATAPRSRRALLGGGRPSAAAPGTGARSPVRNGDGARSARTVMLSVAPDAPLSRPLAGAGCTGCAACTQVCPTGALQWSETASTAVLQVDEPACIACGECVRVCPDDVLGLGCTLPAGARPSFGPSQVTRLRFERCDRCDVRLRAGEQGRCSRCASRKGLLDDVWAQYAAPVPEDRGSAQRVRR